MRESTVEGRLKDAAQLTGEMRSYKWVSPGLNGVPDQILLRKIPAEHLELVSRYIRFVEVKRPGETPDGQQQIRHAELAVLGFRVDVVDNVYAAEDLVQEMAKA